MKIGVDAREFTAKGKTGIGRYLENLLAPLTRGAGIDFVLFVNRREFIPANLAAPSVKLVALPVLPTMVVDQLVLPYLARREKVDVFFSPYYKTPLPGQFTRIITVHDISFLRQAGLGCVTRLIVTRQLQASTRKADLILVDSDFTGQDLVDFIPGLKGKIHRLYPDLSTDWLQPVDRTGISRIQAQYLNGHPCLLYVGNFKPHKNVDLLVYAFAKLVKEHHANDRRLLLVGGDPANRLRIRQLIAGCGMTEHVMIHSNVSDEDLRGLYTTADWFVTASSYEGFGYPLLEAMASGCPVICHLNTSLPEVAGKAALEIAQLTLEGIMQALQSACYYSDAGKREFAQKGKRQTALFLPGTAASQFAALLRT
jgi:alpha-1,3-rhamnosyl/mannosyltransferase